MLPDNTGGDWWCACQPSQGKDPWQCQNLGEKHGVDPLLAWSCQHLDFRCLASRAMRAYISLILRYPVCGALSWQPWETTTLSMWHSAVLREGHRQSPEKFKWWQLIFLTASFTDSLKLMATYLGKASKPLVCHSILIKPPFPTKYPYQ